MVNFQGKREPSPIFYNFNFKIIITFGNQVSSVLLSKNIKVSKYRKKYEILNIYKNVIKIFPVYYPVGQGMRNIKKAKEDINWIIKNQIYDKQIIYEKSQENM